MKRQSGIIVDVTRSTEPIDFDAWARAYVRDCLEAIRAARVIPPAEAA